MSARKITIQFGLLTIACKSEVATEKRASMSNLCVGQPNRDAHDPVPLTMPKQCANCGPIVDFDVLKKGVKSGQSYTLIDKEEVESEKDSYGKQYKGKLALVPHAAEEFLTRTAPGDTVHYLTPADAAAADHYQLLVRLIREHPELAFASLHTPSSATSLYRVTVREGVLVMEKRAREDSLKPVPSVGGVVNDALYAMLNGGLGMFVTEYSPDAYEDVYGKAVARMIADGETVTVGGPDPVSATPVALSDDQIMVQMKALMEAS